MRVQGDESTVGRVSRHHGTSGTTVTVALRAVRGREASWYAWQGPLDAPRREWHQVDGETERQFLRRVIAEG
jgi:hypothetical protein